MYAMNMNKLSTEKRVRVVAALVEGVSIRGTVRMTGVAKNTITKLLADLGSACAGYQYKTLVNLPCKIIEADEIWSFCYAKRKNVPLAMKGDQTVGDIWTFVALDAETKLIPTWFVGKRTLEDAILFLSDLRARVPNRIQLSTDGHNMYPPAIEAVFGDNIHHGVIVKMYGAEPQAERRYSPAKCIGAKKKAGIGAPDPTHISTSYVERQNLTMRMNIRRFTRLTNSFSKKMENHCHAIALHFMYYNFVRIHQTLRVTPAMEAGVTDHVWTLEDVIGLLDSN